MIVDTPMNKRMGRNLCRTYRFEIKEWCDFVGFVVVSDGDGELLRDDDDNFGDDCDAIDPARDVYDDVRTNSKLLVIDGSGGGGICGLLHPSYDGRRCCC